MSLQISGIQDCCGAQLIYDFSGRDQDWDEYDEGSSLQEYREKLKEDLKQRLERSKHLGFSVVFLNGYQHDRFGDVLKEVGFQRTKPSVNRNHSHRIYLYFFKHNPDESYDDADGE